MRRPFWSLWQSGLNRNCFILCPALCLFATAFSPARL